MMPRTAVLLATAILVLAGCKEGKPAANRIDAANNSLVDGVATTEGEKALRETIRIGRPRKAGAPAVVAVSPPAAGETCIERFGANLDRAKAWATKLPAGFALPADARVIEAAGRDGAECAIRIVSTTTRGADRDAVAAAWTRAAEAAGYDAGRSTRGADLIVAGTRGDAAYVAMIGAPAGGSVPVDWVWSKGG